ncbi:hypothetical protein [Methanobacterium sp. SMA-27]|uniref:hypothetical protein n=1 Tax=Methanobacterium sp. SMA-27 TaxID=1495336 RepID=UPI00064EEAD9|nr:hypothetical protein [Methanobacterium sp. SMA-27]
MRWILVIIAIIALLVGYSYITTANGPIAPLGRDGFVKFLNPDMYPGHPHSKLLAKYADERGSKTALVVHFGGSSNYRSYQEGDVYIIEMAFIDTQGTGAAGQTDYLDSLKVAIFGIPDGRYKFKSDGMIFNTYDDAMNHINTLAKAHGQTGPIPMVWHGTARSGNPILVQGCGFPLYFDILEKTYGIIPAYFYTITGMFFPYFNNPTAFYEIQHATELQNLYTQGDLNYD